MERITVGSLFDGIGGWQLAAEHAGAVPVWSSEIDPFPMAVSHAHFPDTKQLGDITKIKGDEIDPVDIICAGSPCQDLSIAGQRAGLDGKRSNLFYQALRIVWEMRAKTNGEYPRFFIWENVTGAFSSNGRRDFQAVLAEIGQADIPMPKSGRWARSGMVRSEKCGISWRALDAQFWGVPQHRERIFLVAGFGKWGKFAKVLFEPESVSGNPCESEKRGEGITAGAGESVDTAGKIVFSQRQYSKYEESEVGSSIRAMGGTCGGVSENIACVYENHMKSARYKEKEIVPSLSARMGTGGNNVPLTCSGISTSNLGEKGSLVNQKGNAFSLTGQDHHVMESKIARRLTPTECERLQGLPDGYTAYGADSKRYKALGNGMAQPCADYVMGQVVKAFAEKAV